MFYFRRIIKSKELHVLQSLWIKPQGNWIIDNYNRSSHTHTPHAPCTELAPTGSSILSLSKMWQDNIASAPPIAPTIRASQGWITAHAPTHENWSTICNKKRIVNFYEFWTSAGDPNITIIVYLQLKPYYYYLHLDQSWSQGIYNFPSTIVSEEIINNCCLLKF